MTPDGHLSSTCHRHRIAVTWGPCRNSQHRRIGHGGTGDGQTSVPGRLGGWQVFDAKGKVAAQGPGRRPSDDHIGNLFDCVRTRKRPTADAEEIHLSTVLCHIANISHRVGGARLVYDGEREQFVNNAEANKLVKRPGRKPYQIPEDV